MPLTHIRFLALTHAFRYALTQKDQHAFSSRHRPHQRATPSDNLMWGFSVKFYPTHTALAKPEAQATSQTDLGTHMRAKLLDSDFQS